MKNAPYLLLASLIASLASSSLPGNVAAQSSISRPYLAPTIDPATGLEVTDPASSHMWYNSEWKDPNITLGVVNYDPLSINGVAEALREAFKHEFDIVLPTGGPVDPNSGLEGGFAWAECLVSLQLRNVTASEILQAMNLQFENDKLPLRWEPRTAGKRQIALLRVLPYSTTIQSVDIVRKVYFVGDLISEDPQGNQTIDQIIETIKDVWVTTDTQGGRIQFHKGAQLVIATGTREQIDFVEQTLLALRQKHQLEQQRKQTAARPAQTNPGAAGAAR